MKKLFVCLEEDNLQDPDVVAEKSGINNITQKRLQAMKL